MAIVKMKKLTIALIDEVREELISKIQSLGVMHIDLFDLPFDEMKERVSWTKDLSELSIDFSECEEQRKDIHTALLFINEKFNKSLPYFEITSSETIEKISEKYHFATLANDLKNLEKQTKDLQSQIIILNQELELIKKWSFCVDDFDPIHGVCSILRGVVGSISQTNLEDLRNSIAFETDLADILVCWSENKESYCYIVSEISVWDKVNAVIKETSFNLIQVTNRNGKSKDILKSLENELVLLRKKYELTMNEWQDYAHKVNDLALVHDILEMKVQKMKATASGLCTEHVNFFRGWVSEYDLPKVEAILSIYEKAIDVTVEDVHEDEYSDVPVLLNNNSITRPFAVLTNMYGTPMYGATVDPTPHLSVFYFIYYGVCLGDALYGVALSLFSVVMSIKNRANQSASNFYALLAWSGISSVLAGVVFGSYAGDLFSKYFPIPALINLKFVYNDGLSFFDKPLFVLFISLLIGALQLWYGYWIKFFVSLKNTGIQAFFNEFPWLILLAGFFGWAVFSWIASMAGLNIVSNETVRFFFLLMKIGALLIIVNSMRKGFQRGIIPGFLGPLAGAWELYGLSGYLSNLLSYARLLALGLSSGIIANVFNQLGFDMMKNLSNISPILGYVAIFLLIGLHIFNLVLGGFGAFVHALRLQFVEFFGQFIEGGGKDFKPLMPKGSYYRIK